MTENVTDTSLEQRISRTLQLAEERGYNLTVEQLSSKLIGGTISINKLCQILPNMKNIEVNNSFIANKGYLYLRKCEQRQQTNSTFYPYYQHMLQILQPFKDQPRNSSYTSASKHQKK